MHLLKVSLAIVALAAPLASARAQEGGDENAATIPAATAEATAAPAPAAAPAVPLDQGWVDTWAMLFDLSLSDSLVGGFEGVGLGGQYYLAPDMAVRLTLGFWHSSDPRAVVEHVDETAGSRVVTYSLYPDASASNTSSATDLVLNADFLYRLTLKSVAPYAGGGLWASMSRSNDDFEDDASVVNQVTTQDGYYRTTALGVRGLIGAEWRLHPSFSLFAEYELSVTVGRQLSWKSDTVTEITIDGERTVHHQSTQAKTKSSFDTSLESGGRAGVAVHF